MQMDMSSSGASSTMASSMDMASSTMASMASSTSSMDMSSSTTSMDMDMHMYFTTQYKDYPVLFKQLQAKNAGQAFGIFVLLFVVAFLVRGIEFTRNYLELVVWKNPTYVDCHPGESAERSETPNCCGETDSIHKSSSSVVENQFTHGVPSKLPLASSLVRDAIRLVLCILPDLFGFALMLAAMSYTLTYFFAVVIGLGVGRFFFERRADRQNLKPVGQNGAFHCS